MLAPTSFARRQFLLDRDRELEAELGALAGDAGDVDGAAVDLDDVFDDREAEARSAHFAGAGRSTR